MHRLLQQAKALLENIINEDLTDEKAIRTATELAEEILQISHSLETSSQHRRMARIANLIRHPQDKLFILNFTDRFFRPSDPRRSIKLLDEMANQNKPSYLSKGEFTFFKIACYFGKIIPNFIRGVISFIIRRQTDELITNEKPSHIESLIRTLKFENIEANLNHLGEAILGEEEAIKRLRKYILDFDHPSVSMVSVKISSIFSQINLLAFDDTLLVLKERLKALASAASKNNGWIMLDMEEWKDLDLTYALLKETLNDQEMSRAKIGIALQAYIPYSSTILEDLIQWSLSRVEEGKEKVRVRLVKGANLPMEKVEASLKGWPQAPYTKKEETDAHFMYMLHRLVKKDAQKALHIAVGSHNVFDLCYAAVIAASNNILNNISLETLSGMAPSISQTLARLVPHSVLYCPLVANDEFHTALAYLTRRLDENTSRENFLAFLALDDEEKDKTRRKGASESLLPEDRLWQKQQESFEKAILNRTSIHRGNRRVQNRLEETPLISKKTFSNSPDTDWSLPQNRKWAQNIIKEWQSRPSRRIPLQIGGDFCSGITSAIRQDPSRPGYIIHEHQLAGPSNIEKAIQTALRSAEEITQSTAAGKAHLLISIAAKLEENRSRLIGSMIQEVAKPIWEADSEVSEAIDFCRYYASQLTQDEMLFSTPESSEHNAVSLICSPWNFPVSIPINGIIASLATNKAVLFKPAPEAIGTGWEVVNCLWEAGVPHTYLQFIPTRDDPEGHILLQDTRIQFLFLTGSTETGRLFLKKCPQRRLFAETGGKNAIIVTQSADLDLAVKEIIASSFGYSGQKCSACSLLIVEKALLDNSDFLDKLKDAASSLPVGSAWDLRSKVTPLAKDPSNDFMKAFSSLENDEKWLLKPFMDPINPQLFSPGIKIGVTCGSFSHQKELFGPILSVIEAESFTCAVQFANQTQYGLTAGLMSLDPAEQAYFLQEIQSGNRYVNRSITGAIVGRQPFGGIKASSFGTGMKAGGPSYLVQLITGREAEKRAISLSNHQQLHLTCSLLPIESNQTLVDISREYASAYENFFAKPKQMQNILGQENFIRYEPHDAFFIHIDPLDQFQDIWCICSIAALLGCTLHITGENLDISSTCSMRDLKAFCLNKSWYWYDSQGEFLEAFKQHPFPRFRAFRKGPTELIKSLSQYAQSIEIIPPSHNGRVELIHFLKEISISFDYHRFGNLQGREEAVGEISHEEDPQMSK